MKVCLRFCVHKDDFGRSGYCNIAYSGGSGGPAGTVLAGPLSESAPISHISFPKCQFSKFKLVVCLFHASWFHNFRQ